MYRLHIANKNYSSWSLRPWVLMRELGIEFEECLTPFVSSGSWSDFRHFSPTGQVPCLVDEETVIWESLGIVEYLAERHPGVWPQASQPRAWARCASAEMHGGFGQLRQRCTMNCGIRARLHDQPDVLLKELTRLDELWCEGLDRFGGPFLAGADFTAVDAFFAPVAFRLQSYDLRLSEPAMAYAERLLQLPSLRAWYQAALDETWREPGHEDEILVYARIVEDLRRQ